MEYRARLEGEGRRGLRPAMSRARRTEETCQRSERISGTEDAGTVQLLSKRDSGVSQSGHDARCASRPLRRSLHSYSNSYPLFSCPQDTVSRVRRPSRETSWPLYKNSMAWLRLPIERTDDLVSIFNTCKVHSCSASKETFATEFWAK